MHNLLMEMKNSSTEKSSKKYGSYLFHINVDTYNLYRANSMKKEPVLNITAQPKNKGTRYISGNGPEYLHFLKIAILCVFSPVKDAFLVYACEIRSSAHFTNVVDLSFAFFLNPIGT